MNLQEFRATLANDTPPQGISTALQAMWHQGKGDWNAAHSLTQSDKSVFGSWVHAHLHRVEGDKVNAAYWYRLAGKPFCTLRIYEEWVEIVEGQKITFELQAGQDGKSSAENLSVTE